jgi:hypothetical protein
MKRLLTAVVFVSFAVTTSLAAQSFGDLFPLTNTRYGTAFGFPHLTTNGRDFFLFWTSDLKIRATQLTEEESRAGHVVLDISAGFDVAWTGQRFLAVTTRDVSPSSSDSNIVGRFLAADARPIGEERVIAPHGFLPRVVAGPESVLLIYRDLNGEVRALPLAANGANTDAPGVTIAPQATGYAVASNETGFVAAIADSTEIRSVAFNKHGQAIANRTMVHGESYYREVSVASDGTQYVAVWCEEQAVVAVTIDANGTFGAPLILDSSTRFPRTPTVIWNGAGWTITYEGRRSVEWRARVVQLDRDAQRIVAEEESAVGLGSPSVAALDGRIVAAWAPVNYQPGGVSVIDLPLAANQPRPATFSATQQTLMATATSANGTLVVWTEGGDGSISLRSGLRTNDGRWTERELAGADLVQQVLAGSDGRNFVVVYADQGHTQLIRLDETGQVVAPRSTLSILPVVMAWNGTHYALIDRSGTGRLLSPAGGLSAPVMIPDVTFIPETLASDGNGFLLAGEVQECPFILCYSVGIRGTRLSPELTRVDSHDIAFAEGSGELAGAAWNGSEYVMIWADEMGNRASHVPSTPLQPIETHSIVAPLIVESVAAMSDGSVALVGRSPGSPELIGNTRVAILPQHGDVATTYDIEDTLGLMRRALLAPLTNGGLAYVASSVQDAAPHHGTSHVMMAVARPSLVSRPEAPFVTTRLTGAQIEVDWSSPAGTVNGYRLEYRVDNGAWNELEQWFEPGSHHTSIPRAPFGTNYAVRMRAFNDGGVSAYSAAASTQPGKRRAATH